MAATIDDRLQHEDIAGTSLGLLDKIAEELVELRRALVHGEKWGAVDAIERVRWPVSGVNRAEWTYRGTFKSIVVVNENAFDIFVGTSPGSGRANDARSLIVGPRSFVVLPARDSNVSVGADTAGTAVLIPLDVVMPFTAGPIGAPGAAAATPTFVDVTDDAARLLGRTSFGIADSVSAAGIANAPAAGTVLCTIPAASLPAGIYLVCPTTRINTDSAADSANIQLRRGGAVVSRLFGGNTGVPLPPFRLTLDGTQALDIQVIGAGVAFYTVSLTATRLE